MTRRRYAVIAGGGTAGHAMPALAVARALSGCGHGASTVQMIGSNRGQEGTLFAEGGFPVLLLGGRGLRRDKTLAALAVNAVSLLAMTGAVLRATVAMIWWRPCVVVSVGGFASFPAALGAVVSRIPLVLVNVDAVPGLVHRLFDRYSSAAAVAFPDTPLKRSTVTGTPVRREIAEVARAPDIIAWARHELGVPEGRRVVVSFGGSLGARTINQAMVALAQRWADRKDLAFYHVTGRRDFEAMRQALAADKGESIGGENNETSSAPHDETSSAPHDETGRTAGGVGLWHRLVAYEDRMALLYEAADVVVSRAGAMTVAELSVAGVPAILVPLPGAPSDHQRANATALVRAGGALLIPDDECDVSRLARVIEDLLREPGRLEVMGLAARRLGHPDAADRVAGVVERCAR